MRKKINKELYTYYTLEGDFYDFKDNPRYNVVSYSNGKVTCAEYHDTLDTWAKEIVRTNYKNAFGVKSYTEDGLDRLYNTRNDVSYHFCDTENMSVDDILKIMANIINYYLDDSQYYEIKDDNIYIYKELSGHMYYGSIHESCDDCGTCNGARCDSCVTRYIVEDLITNKLYYRGSNKEEAERIRDEHKKDYSNIIDDILDNYDIDMEWFEKEINGASDIKALFKIINKYTITYITLN